jgi:hypothetical protein
MNVSLSRGTIQEPPVSGVGKVEVRDSLGNLLVLCVEMPGGGAVLVTRVGEKDFEWNAANHKVPLVDTAGGSGQRIILG